MRFLPKNEKLNCLLCSEILHHISYFQPVTECSSNAGAHPFLGGGGLLLESSLPLSPPHSCPQPALMKLLRLCASLVHFHSSFSNFLLYSGSDLNHRAVALLAVPGSLP